MPCSALSCHALLRQRLEADAQGAAVLHEGADRGASFNALWARPIESEPRALDLSFAHPEQSVTLQFGN